ncbi:5-deoxy-glucuronate isomerase [Kordiimonas lacus]|uniref:5-deoxyglucuronate isomerase n=1 Tax=Kordiimonas lacus TaxID=637679 RepID=A0A1G7D4S8_9PROT|nr:5-deoxy-glucuronate isomerase [Kordiimonas lacus]SDE46503.1 5-deoxyglucuronate isomerase [Kordiimonas lacus]
MLEHITDHRDGFRLGHTVITDHRDAAERTGIGVAVWRLKAGERISETFDNEAAWLLMDGEVTISVAGKAYEWSRTSLFDEHPSCLHGPKGTVLEVTAKTDAEFTIYQCANEADFPIEKYEPDAGVDEPRGKGQVGGTCLRFVRTIFDDTNSSPNAQLVLGEVITMPGKWSSYPPHNHPQPEIYHYRFTDPRGWGHGELDDDVLKIRPYDSVRIMDMKTHAQVAAPGYGMYYSWVIRHLPAKRYGVPEFAQEHAWTMEEDADFWQPKGVTL